MDAQQQADITNTRTTPEEESPSAMGRLCRRTLNQHTFKASLSKQL